MESVNQKQPILNANKHCPHSTGILINVSMCQSCQRPTYKQHGELITLIKKQDSHVMSVFPGAWQRVFEGAC